MKKENKISFVIIRVTKKEKDQLLKLAQKTKYKFSDFIRNKLGL